MVIKVFPAKCITKKESLQSPKLSALPPSNCSCFLFLLRASGTGNVLHKVALAGDSLYNHPTGKAFTCQALLSPERRCNPCDKLHRTSSIFFIKHDILVCFCCILYLQLCSYHIMSFNMGLMLYFLKDLAIKPSVKLPFAWNETILALTDRR